MTSRLCFSLFSRDLLIKMHIDMHDVCVKMAPVHEQLRPDSGSGAEERGCLCVQRPVYVME